jgi:subtilisin family serine protease
MGGLARAALLGVATVLGALTPALSQSTNIPTPPPIVSRGTPIMPFGWYVMGSVACAAVSPMIATVVLGRELTLSEAYHTTLGCMLGPVGWLLVDAMFPPTVTGPKTGTPSGKSGRVVRGRHFNIPAAGETRFVPNEVLLEFAAGASNQYRISVETRLQLTLLEIQTFQLTGRTIGRYRIDGTRSVADTLRQARNLPRVSAGQANIVYVGVQSQPAVKHDPPADAGAAQYVVRKLHLLEAHRINSGDDVLVAVIVSKIDAGHPDLVGVIAAEYDAVGTPSPAHAHGTAMAGAIAAHSKLIGGAPKVKLLAARAFSGTGESAQSTTFNILKGLDWAASKNARIINMSFAGPADAVLQVMLVNANGRGMTATDPQDRLMPTRPDLPDGVPVFGPVTVAGTSHPPVSSMRSLWLTQPANSRRGEQSAGRRAPINFVDRLPWSRRIP